MILIRCKCGQALGKVAGAYEFRCHKCKQVVLGTTQPNVVAVSGEVFTIDAVDFKRKVMAVTRQ